MQNLVSCVYATKLAGVCRHVTITWVKDAKGHGLCVTVDEPSCKFSCKIKMSPWSFWKKQGSKVLKVSGNSVDIFWDLSSAKYLCGPEPCEAFYVAVVCNEEMVLLLGDKEKDAYKRSKARPAAIKANVVSRTEHVFGKKHFCIKARFGELAKSHDINIEWHAKPPVKEPLLIMKVDRKVVVQVKNLEWKFRGNQTILVDGFPVEVFWDVRNWIFDSGNRNAIFMFQTELTGGMQTTGKSKDMEGIAKWSGELNGSISAMKLYGTRSLRSPPGCVGFAGSSLMLHAWKTE